MPREFQTIAMQLAKSGYRRRRQRAGAGNGVLVGARVFLLGTAGFLSIRYLSGGGALCDLTTKFGALTLTA